MPSILRDSTKQILNMPICRPDRGIAGIANGTGAAGPGVAAAGCAACAAAGIAVAGIITGSRPIA